MVGVALGGAAETGSEGREASMLIVEDNVDLANSLVLTLRKLYRSSEVVAVYTLRDMEEYLSHGEPGAPSFLFCDTELVDPADGMVHYPIGLCRDLREGRLARTLIAAKSTDFRLLRLWENVCDKYYYPVDANPRALMVSLANDLEVSTQYSRPISSN